VPQERLLATRDRCLPGMLALIPERLSLWCIAKLGRLSVGQTFLSGSRSKVHR